MNKPPPVLVDAWIKILNTQKRYLDPELIEITEDKLYSHFDSVKEADMYLYLSGFYS
tara:strand:- start:52 stop:222 length:171 start_codon:yes stop_codon:yes gene_type:complete